MVEREGAKWTSDPNQTDEISGARSAADSTGGNPPSPPQMAPPGTKEPGRAPFEPHRASRAPRVWRLVFVIALVVLGAVLGYQLAHSLFDSIQNSDSSAPFVLALRELSHNLIVLVLEELAFAILGGLLTYLLASTVFHKVEDLSDGLKSMSVGEKGATFTGLAVGLLFTVLLSPIMLSIPKVGILVSIVAAIFFAYVGVNVALSMKDEVRLFQPAAPIVPETPKEALSAHKILDTNVIIDGRITDICRTGFIEGPVYVPGFVLDELQHIADSSDALKRARGRRGLDILNQMRSEMPLIVRTLDTKVEYPHMEEVDAKLVRLAKKLEGMIVTNDFNLNKVAELQGVPVLNINELANALKPVVLPGEEMHVTVIKEGKEMNQGIAYLDDGTMIVIEGARRRIGENLDVVVSSVLQTVAGKMIFATIRMDEDGNYEEGDRGGYDQGPRGYPGSRPRRPPGR